MNRNKILIIVGAIILCFAGLNNKFPLLTPDTGTYIDSGFSKNVPYDRTITYGLFTAHASWGSSLWLVIFSQGLIMSLVLFYYFRYFSLNIYYVVFYLACLFFITFCMSASVSASTINAGVFGGIAFLCIGLLLFAENLTQRDFIIIAITAAVSVGMDISYLLTATILLFIYTLSLVYIKKSQISNHIRTTLKRVAITVAIVITGWLLIFSSNYFFGSGFGIVREKNVYILPRLINSGQAHEYLENIKEKNLSIYQYKDSLKLFITDNSRFNKSVLSPADVQVYKEIASWIISQNGFSLKFFSKALDDFFFQVLNIKINADSITDKTIKTINRRYNIDVRECLLSRQFQHVLSLKYLNYTQIISTLLSACLLVFLIFSKISFRHKNIAVYILWTLIIHAFLTAALYGNQNEMQSQIIWMLPIPVFLYISETGLINNLKQKFF